jgi:hypothetical protein
LPIRLLTCFFSFFRFSLPLLLPHLLPLLVAVLQSKITVQYNIANQLQMSNVPGS